jgi:hypothetical protein
VSFDPSFNPGKFISGRAADGTFVSAPIETQRSFTPQQIFLLNEIKSITPRGYVEGIPNSFDVDIRLLGFASQAISDYNLMPPQEAWTTSFYPPDLPPLVAFGTQVYLAILKQMELALIDISYNDNGLSISFNRTANLNTSITTMKTLWERRVWDRKRGYITAMGGMGLATPRWNSSLSRFLDLLGNGAFGWGII